MHKSLAAVLCLLTLFLTGCQTESQPKPERAPGVSLQSRHFAMRLRPGQDLKKELRRVMDKHGFTAVGVVTCVGSLTKVTLRYANQDKPTTLTGHFEIVAMEGTLEPKGGHLHLAVSDGQGRTYGGHLLDGSAVYTTAEIILVSLDDLQFSRKKDPTTTYYELHVESK